MQVNKSILQVLQLVTRMEVPASSNQLIVHLANCPRTDSAARPGALCISCSSDCPFITQLPNCPLMAQLPRCSDSGLDGLVDHGPKSRSSHEVPLCVTLRALEHHGLKVETHRAHLTASSCFACICAACAGSCVECLCALLGQPCFKRVVLRTLLVPALRFCYLLRTQVLHTTHRHTWVFADASACIRWTITEKDQETLQLF